MNDLQHKKSLPIRLWIWFIRTFFRLLYGPFAWTYDVVAWLVSLGQWTAWGRTALRFLHGPAVLELGHGPGHLQVAMAREGLTAVGLDISPQMGRLARRRVLRADLPLRLVRARTQALPFCDRAFSDVVATFPAEYILDPRTLREVKRVLPSEGKVVVVATAWFTGRDPPARFLEWLYRITGQRAPLPKGDEPLLVESGLVLQAEWVPARSSQVLVVIGKRQPGDQPGAATPDGTSGCTSAPPTEARSDPGREREEESAGRREPR